MKENPGSVRGKAVQAGDQRHAGVRFSRKHCCPYIADFCHCVYDIGIGSRSTNTVVMLALGAGIVIATNLALRSIRARTMAYFGAPMDSLISMKSFEVIFNMPVSMIDRLRSALRFPASNSSKTCATSLLEPWLRRSSIFLSFSSSSSPLRSGAVVWSGCLFR